MPRSHFLARRSVTRNTAHDRLEANQTAFSVHSCTRSSFRRATCHTRACYISNKSCLGWLRRLGAMGNKQATLLNEFQREKLLHEFKTFYDMDGDGVVTWKDFELAKERITKLNRWPPNSEKVQTCQELYADIWDSLQRLADSDSDGAVTSKEWLSMWEHEVRKIHSPNPTVDDLPLWIHRYLVHRFHVLDRTGDGIIDQDEFEYVMNEFNIPISECRKAWLIFSKNNSVKVDLAVFTNLANEYFFSSDPAALGNFIMGRLRFGEHKGSK